MFDQTATEIAHVVAKIIELVGIAIIALGAFGTLGSFVYRIGSPANRDEAVANFRSCLGRAILLGLEFLVAADIINTVAVEPTLLSVAVLAAIVVVRTFLSFSLEVEIEGRWPWDRRKGQQRQV
ncbi:MAG: DUF1622 domain-containing protein [Sphingomonas sp.]|nr:DUF1622 domain-containing protein [Sphingomonas sp.]